MCARRARIEIRDTGNIAALKRSMLYDYWGEGGGSAGICWENIDFLPVI